MKVSLLRLYASILSRSPLAPLGFYSEINKMKIFSDLLYIYRAYRPRFLSVNSNGSIRSHRTSYFESSLHATRPSQHGLRFFFGSLLGSLSLSSPANSQAHSMVPIAPIALVSSGVISSFHDAAWSPQIRLPLFLTLTSGLYQRRTSTPQRRYHNATHVLSRHSSPTVQLSMTVS